MSRAPSTFDMGEIAHTLLLFGHLGPLIAGTEWKVIFETTAREATTPAMIAFHKNLPSNLTEVQRLTFKPYVTLTDSEHACLVQHFGGLENPIVRYFRAKMAKHAAHTSSFTETSVSSSLLLTAKPHGSIIDSDMLESTSQTNSGLLDTDTDTDDLPIVDVDMEEEGKRLEVEAHPPSPTFSDLSDLTNLSDLESGT
ncbi:hypothetical protein B0H10DRAFT_1970196 [Mycena sp. CBHHK59/15]|nr:hypothetical protein B0H10DRAFT_1970196 [Mycena sp. CBHHK59/15]